MAAKRKTAPARRRPQTSDDDSEFEPNGYLRKTTRVAKARRTDDADDAVRKTYADDLPQQQLRILQEEGVPLEEKREFDRLSQEERAARRRAIAVHAGTFVDSTKHYRWGTEPRVVRDFAGTLCFLCTRDNQAQGYRLHPNINVEYELFACSHCYHKYRSHIRVLECIAERTAELPEDREDVVQMRNQLDRYLTQPAKRNIIIAELQSHISSAQGNTEGAEPTSSLATTQELFLGLAAQTQLPIESQNPLRAPGVRTHWPLLSRGQDEDLNTYHQRIMDAMRQRIRYEVEILRPHLEQVQRNTRLGRYFGVPPEEVNNEMHEDIKGKGCFYLTAVEQRKGLEPAIEDLIGTCDERIVAEAHYLIATGRTTESQHQINAKLMIQQEADYYNDPSTTTTFDPGEQVPEDIYVFSVPDMPRAREQEPRADCC